jgi:hypothetical protein
MPGKNPVKQYGTIRELEGRESDADEARREEAALVAKLRSKQITVDGGLTPADVMQTGPPEGAVLKGGPFDGLAVSVARGASEFTRPAASPGVGNPFVPAKYRRTKERSKEQLTVFQFAD